MMTSVRLPIGEFLKCLKPNQCLVQLKAGRHKYCVVPSSELVKNIPLRYRPHTEEELKDRKYFKYNPDMRFKYPDFLPHPYAFWRNPIREKLERSDMLKRRFHIDIPEFYVGSILAVTSSTIHAPQKTTRFLGICVLREGTGLCSNFTLRNVVDKQGVEFMYELYDPKIQKIEVIRLEKRLDSELVYLRDAEPEYSTFPFDMEPEYLPDGQPVPVNPLKVKMRPRPWLFRYEVQDYQGILPFELSEARTKRLKKLQKRPTKHDLMWHYRATIPEDEQREIYAEVCPVLDKYQHHKRVVKRKVEFIPPTKTA